MKIDSVCTKCGAPLDPDGYCSFHQPTRTVPTQVIVTQKVTSNEVGELVDTSNERDGGKIPKWMYFVQTLFLIVFPLILGANIMLGLPVLTDKEIDIMHVSMVVVAGFSAAYMFKMREFIAALILLAAFILRLGITLARFA